MPRLGLTHVQAAACRRCCAHLFEKQQTLSGTRLVSEQTSYLTLGAVVLYTAPTATARVAHAGTSTALFLASLPAAAVDMIPKS